MVTLTSSGDLLASSSNTNDDALTPALVAGLEGSTHDTNVASAVEGVVTATISHLNQLLLNALSVELGRVNEVGSTELAGPGLLAIVYIDNNDLTGLVLHSTLDDRETDTSGTEDGDIGTFLNLGGNNGGTVTGGDTTAEQAGSVSGGLGSDGNDRDIGNDGVLREGGGTHEVQDVLSTGPEAGGAIGHDTATLGSPDLTAKVGLSRLAELALAALGSATQC